MRVVALLVLVGCGRFGFGEYFDADGPQVAEDGPADVPDDAGPADPPDASAPPDAPPDAGPPAGLVVWFPLDATPQNTADVVSGINGTCAGSTCPAVTTGKHGGAFLFDGDNDCIVVPDMGQFGQARLTLSLWMRQDAADACSPVAKPVDLNATANTWQIETTDDNRISFTTSHAQDSNERVTTPASTITIGQWHHVAATYDGTTKQIYVDGALISSGNASGALTYNNDSVRIGCDENNGSPALRFNGALDEIQLYNRALSLAEIQMLAAM